MYSEITETILAFSWAFIIAIFAIPSITYLAHLKNLLDVPNGRTIHESLTPRLGGLAIFAGFMSSLTIFGDFLAGNDIQYMLAGCILIFFIGLKDDISPVSPFKKFFVQVLSAGIVLVLGDIRITGFYGFLHIYGIEPGISYAFSFLMIIGVTNAINLIDGLDGLAGSIIFFISITFGAFFLMDGSPYAIVAFCLGGAVFGFLRYNIFRASIFMGDTGSLVSGFIIALLAVKIIEEPPEVLGNTSAVMALATLIIPVGDTLRVFFLRTISGRSPFEPDKNHIHHRLIDLGCNQLQTVFSLIFVNILFVILAFYLRTLSINQSIPVLFCVLVVIFIIVELLHHRIKRRSVN